MSAQLGDASIPRTSLKKRLRYLARRHAGLDVRSVQPFDDEFETLVHVLEHLGRPCVVDIGANDGGFGRNLFRAGWTGQVLSFEPLVDAHASLRRTSQSYSGWVVAPRCALGDRDGAVPFHVAGNSSSSSTLVMRSLHTEVAPESRTIETTTVEMKRLDSIIPSMKLGGAALFLKIDTQGSEGTVLEGAAGVMDYVVGLRAEVSFAELYEGQEQFDALYVRIRGMGFDLWDLTPVLRDARSGQMLQADATFVKTNIRPTRAT
jgi:FkbM family methyltransferase